MKTAKLPFWTHSSVKPFLQNGDPVEGIVQRANICVIEAMEDGWEGPPFDTFQLANLLGFEVIPCESIRDARLIPITRDRYRIEYNPNQPRGRIRFSIAHEIAHTFFPDCRELVRNRSAKRHMKGDDWQLEMLCNIGAAELLMPMASFPEIDEAKFSIDTLLNLRKKYQVSTEAILLRFVRLARTECAVFGASYQSPDSERISVDYVKTANDWDISLPNGFMIPAKSVVYDCGAIGFTAKECETWDKSMGEIEVECVAIPSYPGANNPRVIGMLSPSKPRSNSRPTINYLVGDAREPRGNGVKIIAQVVNDKTPRWGGGFAKVVKQCWPEVQADFIDWYNKSNSNLRLGNSHFFQIKQELFIFHMIAQHGYRQSNRPGIRYHALENGLRELLELAYNESASIHMPRIGCGQAGGSWAVVSGLIDSILCCNGISVTVYDLPSERERWIKPDRQQTLFDDLDVI